VPSHPPSIALDDPTLERVRRIALALPGAEERLSVGHPTFATTKVFLWFGGSERVDGRSGPRHPLSVVVRPDPGDEPALRQDARFWVPAYLGPFGWIAIDLDDETDWSEISELIDASYRVTAPARLVRELDAR
jgi:predicted DNA-binding protein (MmcQ/YjbR family)